MVYHPPMETTLHILGAGSIGLLLAARLSAVVPVTLIRRPGNWPRRVALDLRDGEQRQTVEVAQATAGELGRVDRLIVCTKAYDALPAVRQLGGRLTTDTALLLMQNGMGSQDAIAAAYPRLSVYAASSTEGAYRLGPDSVVHAGRGITRIGRLHGGETDWVSLFRAAGLACEPAEPIRWHLANKLRVNALINPLTVLYDCRNGELLERPDALAGMRRLGAEADAVLAAAGYHFADSAFDQAADVARRTAANVSSMLQDARAGRQLELEAITGYLLALADRAGISANEHRALYGRLRGVTPR